MKTRPVRALYFDELLSYHDLAAGYAHNAIDHAANYVDGEVHTNGMESYRSLLKRGHGRGAGKRRRKGLFR